MMTYRGKKDAGQTPMLSFESSPPFQNTLTITNAQGEAIGWVMSIHVFAAADYLRSIGAKEKP